VPSQLGTPFFLPFLVVTARRKANVAANRWLGAFTLLMVQELSAGIYGLQAGQYMTRLIKQ
jgi:hypothetical protein